MNVTCIQYKLIFMVWFQSCRWQYKVLGCISGHIAGLVQIENCKGVWEATIKKCGWCRRWPICHTTDFIVSWEQKIVCGRCKQSCDTLQVPQAGVSCRNCCKSAFYKSTYESIYIYECINMNRWNVCSRITSERLHQIRWFFFVIARICFL